VPPPITAVRHLKIWVSDLAASRAWYERVFGLVHETDFPEPDGTVLGSQFFFPGSRLRLAIRQDPERAAALRDADPFALPLTRQELDQWMEHLDALNIWHPPVVETPRGWASGFRDPDGMQIRLYADK
jgi:catechol 2,3-dioxygenase-like lactoylglutathione lyase family enzyme